jgi:hypothetical protein
MCANGSTSAIRLLMRSIVQFNILSPKSAFSAFATIDLPLKRATVVFLVPFSLSFLSHLIFSPPSAGEPTQGYLHGGILIDFIGQRTFPASTRPSLTVGRPRQSDEVTFAGYRYFGIAGVDVGGSC